MADENQGSTPPGGPPVTPAPPGASPSGSTNATLLGGAVACIVMAILAKYGITFPAGVESALATIFAALCGYIPPSGRK